MSVPVFMSEEHVAKMSELLAASDDVRREAASLDRSYLLAYRLSDGPHGDVWWTMSFSPESGVSFGLGKPEQTPDLLLRCDWAAMVRAARAQREGRTLNTDVTTEGDPELMTRVGAVFAAAQRVATVPVLFPDV